MNLSGINLIDFVEKTNLRVSTSHNEREKIHVNQSKRANVSSILRSRSPKSVIANPQGFPLKNLLI